jgi:hypothetical protein
VKVKNHCLKETEFCTELFSKLILDLLCVNSDTERRDPLNNISIISDNAHLIQMTKLSD